MDDYKSKIALISKTIEQILDVSDLIGATHAETARRIATVIAAPSDVVEKLITEDIMGSRKVKQ